MDTISAPDLANTVTAYATVLSGLVALLLTALMHRQPARWMAVYVGIVVTGVATVWYHGFGEGAAASVADIGTNLLLAWLLQMAVLGDYYAPTTRRWIGGASGLVNLAFVVWKILVGAARSRLFVVSFGDCGGFHVGEVLLILDCLLAVGLMYGRHGRIPIRARPLWYAVTAIFVVGMLLATAGNQEVGLRVLAFHAAWHLVGAFGFVVLWAFNHVRFGE